MDKSIAFDGAKKLIESSSNIVVFTGAGISTNCGIPDFRGENGLYSIVGERYNLPYPEAIFELSYFRTNPQPFYDFSSQLNMADVIPSEGHRFLAALEDAGKISLIITQNIDMLHQKAGNEKVLECHGSYREGHCLNCRKTFKYEEFESNLANGQVKYCSCGGLVKPDVVFFGEQLPESFYKVFENPPKADLLLVMGTSLTVQPAATLALRLTESIPSIIINLDSTDYDQLFTYVLNGDIDKIVEEL